VFILPLTLLLLIVDTTTLNGTLSILMIAVPRFGSIVNVRLLQFEKADLLRDGMDFAESKNKIVFPRK